MIVAIVLVAPAIHGQADMGVDCVAISVVAIPIFWTGATVLTYVFVGLRRGRDKAE